MRITGARECEAVAESERSGTMMDWGGGGWDGGFWMMFLFSMIFLVAVIIGIVFLVRALSVGGTGGGGERSSQPQRETPEELVRRRYAAGEIDREEYEQKLRDLRT
jgi:putative membrane protein